MHISDLCKAVHLWAEKKGWNNGLETPDVDALGKQVSNFHSEISEAWEEIRNGHSVTEIYCPTSSPGVPIGQAVESGHKPEGFPIEIADLVIRIAHTCGLYGIDLEKAISLKMEYNHTRAYRHGGKTA